MSRRKPRKPQVRTRTRPTVSVDPAPVLWCGFRRNGAVECSERGKERAPRLPPLCDLHWDAVRFIARGYS